MVSKELVQLFNAYQRETGVHSGAEAAALLTLAHCVRDLQKVFVVESGEHAGRNIASVLGSIDEVANEIRGQGVQV